MAAQEKTVNIFEQLPREFTRRDALEEAFKAGYSRSWLWEKLEKGMIMGDIKRVTHGTYRKTST